METLVTHLTAGAIGAGIVWFMHRAPLRQFHLMLEAIAEGKEEGKDWKFIRDATGQPTGFRAMMSASPERDRPK